MANANIYGPVNMASPLWVQGFLPTAFTNTTITYGTGAARAYQNGSVGEYAGTIQGLPGNITVNTATVGANGCYPNALSAITPAGGLAFAFVYLCWNSSGTTNGSLNNVVAPVLVIQTASTGYIPAGYDSYQIVGFVLVNSSGNLVPYAMNGPYGSRNVTLLNGYQCLSAGTANTATKVDLILGTSGSNLLASYISKVQLTCHFTANAATDFAGLGPFVAGRNTGLQYPINIISGVTTAISTNVEMAIGADNNGNAAIYYQLSSTSDSLDLYVSGFTFHPPFYTE